MTILIHWIIPCYWVDRNVQSSAKYFSLSQIRDILLNNLKVLLSGTSFNPGCQNPLFPLVLRHVWHRKINKCVLPVFSGIMDSTIRFSTVVLSPMSPLFPFYSNQWWTWKQIVIRDRTWPSCCWEHWCHGHTGLDMSDETHRKENSPGLTHHWVACLHRYAC